MTKVAILNDTSRFHLGSAAVMQVIFRTIRELDWEISASFFGNSFLLENSAPEICDQTIEGSDILLINGEGTLHHDSRMSQFLLETIERFSHKKIALINAMWYRMSSASEQKLRHVDLIIARDPRSYERLSRVCPGRCYLTPDLSIRDVPPNVWMRKQSIILGGFYWNQHSRASGVPLEQIVLRRLSGDARIDLTRDAWHVAVNRLRNARLLVTGKHHEVIAACLARCPFLFCPIGTPKIEALGDFASVKLSPIDLRLDRRSYEELFSKTIANKDTYDELFDALSSAVSQVDLVEVLGFLDE